MARLDETYVAFNNPIDQLEKGIECCRKGDWETGMAHLSAVAQSQHKPGELPSRYYSYLGYGMAFQQKRLHEGIKLCRYAIKQEFYQLENYVNLARTYLLAKRRDSAYKTIEKGLKIDPNYPDLVQLHKQLGARRPPVISFLSRTNPLNQILGRIRHSTKASKEKAEAKKTAAEAKKAGAKKAGAKRPGAKRPGAKRPAPSGAPRRPAGRPR